MCLTDCLLSDSTLVVLQMKYSTAVEHKNAICWISKDDVCLAGSPKNPGAIVSHGKILTKMKLEEFLEPNNYGK